MPDVKKLPPDAKGRTRYRAVVDIGRDPATGKRKQLTITKPTAKEVKAEIARLAHKRDAGTLVAPSKVTLGEWLDEWLERKARDVESTTIAKYRLMTTGLREQLGEIRLQDLTEDHVRDFVDGLVGGGRRRGGQTGTRLSVAYVDSILVRLREALELAVIRKVVTANVAAQVRVSLADKKTDRQKQTREKPWTVEEVQTFIRGMAADRLFAPLLLGLMGLRPAEVCGLQWERDITLGSAGTPGQLTLTATRTMVSNAYTVEKSTKTLAGERTLPVPPLAEKALRAYRARQAAERLAAGEAYTVTPYVAVDELGEPLDTRALREYAYRLMKRLGLRRVRLYDARHSCLTALAVAGVPDLVLAAWAGHTNAAFTKAKYVHVGVEHMAEAAAAWEKFAGQM
ncbi:tyrosine recombinase XerC [Streptomyces sp. NPDC048594]|uniref:site-specific integrase n=1 Tax=Streptomyces sp. NPDC048594 TaxID=3365575 RepID=UPI0037134863